MTTTVFSGVTLAGLLTDAQDVVTVAAPLAIIVAFWGASRLVGIIKRFVR